MINQKKLSKRIDKELEEFVRKFKCKLCGNYEKSNNKEIQSWCKNCKKEAKKYRKKYNSSEYLKELYDSGNKFVGRFKCKLCPTYFYTHIVKRDKRHCSNNCRSKIKPKFKKVIKIKCLVCKKVKEFKTESRKGKFCTRRCYEIDKKENWEFPHKGKKINDWMFTKDVLKSSMKRKKLKKRMINFFNENPELLKRTKDKSLIDIFRKYNTLAIRHMGKERGLDNWSKPKNRLKWLKTNGRFQKKQEPWNKGKPAIREHIEKARKTKERNYLKKLGINNGN